jgi:hypothetical protein
MARQGKASRKIRSQRLKMAGAAGGNGVVYRSGFLFDLSFFVYGIASASAIIPGAVAEIPPCPKILGFPIGKENLHKTNQGRARNATHEGEVRFMAD